MQFQIYLIRGDFETTYQPWFKKDRCFMSYSLKLITRARHCHVPRPLQHHHSIFFIILRSLHVDGIVNRSISALTKVKFACCRREEPKFACSFFGIIYGQPFSSMDLYLIFIVMTSVIILTHKRYVLVHKEPRYANGTLGSQFANHQLKWCTECMFIKMIYKGNCGTLSCRVFTFNYYKPANYYFV